MRRVLFFLLLTACPVRSTETPATVTPTAVSGLTGVTGDVASTGETGETPSVPGVSGPTSVTGLLVVQSVTVTDATTIDVVFSRPPPPIAQDAATLDGTPLVSLSTPSPRLLRIRTADFLARPHTLDLSRIASLTNPTHAIQGVVAPLASSFTAVDDPAATNEGPGAWVTQANGTIVQTSNLYGGSSSDRLSLDKPGTYYLHTQAQQDALVQATITNPDDDGMGLIARYVDATHYYRFEWLSQGSQRRLVKIDGATRTLLDFDVAPFVPGTAYRVRLTAVGSRISVFLDDVLILQAQDTSFAQGRFGVYCWGSQGLVVSELAVAPAVSASFPEWAVRLHTAAPIFTHAPMISEIDTTSAMAWVRTSEPANVRALISTNADMSAPQASTVVSTDNATDRTARIPVSGLQPGTRYFVQLEARDKTRNERNLTAPRPFTTALQSGKTDVTFTWFGDVHDGAEARFIGFDAMAADQPDFALALGDFPYADGAPVASTLAEYRWKHAVVRSIPQLDAFIGRVPVYGVWDDHEIANDWDGATSASRVANGVKAWHEWWPVMPHTSAPANAIYRSYKYGNTVELFLLDTRSQRPANSLAQSATKSMLGAAQKAWLLNALQTSTARFKIIVTSIPLRYGTTGNDHWPGYVNERTAILDAVKDDAGVFFITADQHWHAAHAHPEGVWEFMASSLSAGLRTPASPKPAEVVYQSVQHGYGKVQIDGAAETATVSLHDLNGGVLYSKTLP